MTTHTTRTAWLRIAAAVLVGEQLAWFIFHPITVLGSVSLGLVVLLAWLLLLGSRVAWVLAVLLTVSQLSAPFTFDEPVWLAAPGAIVLACLLVPSSRAFVWADKQQRSRRLNSSGSMAQRMRDKFLSVVYGLLARVPWLGGTASEMEAADRPTRGKLTLLLVAGVLIATPLIGALDNFRHDPTHDNVLVDVLWRVAWISYSLAEFTAIVLVVMAAYRYVNKVKGGFKSSGAQSKEAPRGRP